MRYHPRGCGENVFSVCLYVYYVGSPPRMRGKRFGGGNQEWLWRITPADAGKTGITAPA